MYDPIFSKSFSRSERKRFGICGVVILCLIIALSICSTFNNSFHPYPLSIVGDAIDLQLSINAAEDMLISVHDHTLQNSNPQVDMNSATNLKSIINDSQNMVIAHDTSLIVQQIGIEAKPICRLLEGMADYCEIEGDIRIQPNSSTIFIVTPSDPTTLNSINSWTIQPYPRKGNPYVKKWTLTLIHQDNSIEDHNIPKCTQNHTQPAILFSVGGYSGNHFHDFADLIAPLYSTSLEFERDVHFLASDYKPWWISKYRGLLNRLTRHEIVNIDRERSHVLCYRKMVAGLQFNKELIVNPLPSNSTTVPPSGLSMKGFRQFLRQAYSLERKRATRYRKGDGNKPRLMIIVRKRTRILTNEGEISRVARKLGYEVILAEADTSTNVSRFAQVVNSCDVLMGIHGAGLTNMVFLPDDAVLIQIIPLGGIDGFAKLDFGNPSYDMNLKYLEYKIRNKESSLSQQYPRNHQVLRDPKYFHKKGWETLRSIYLDNQNVTIDMHRFKGILAKAINLLRH